jgi:hypothetical protein
LGGEATKRDNDTPGAFGLGDEDLAAWRESGLPDEAFVEWLVDRVARRPTGSWARQVYGAEDVHDFARRAILALWRSGLPITCLRSAAAAGCCCATRS